MTEIDRLGARLRSGWTALLIAAGCTGAGTGTGAPTDPQRVSTELQVMPSCPRGTWSGPLSLAVKLKLGADVGVDGCPLHVERNAQPTSEAEQRQLDELPDGVFGSLDEAATKQAGAGQCAYTWKMECPGGRALIGEDGVVLAAVQESDAWAPRRAADEPDEPLADAWLMDARAEHASIASFARATLELLAVGAPPALVSATQRASLDEVEHARVCFALASRYAGRTLGPGPLPAVGPRAADLRRLACDVFVEGCVGETLAALAAARALRRCEDVEVRGALAKIADDEAQHAALAWATLAWAVERGGDAVRVAVRALAATMQREVFAADVAPAGDAALASRGRLDAAAQQACARDAWRTLIPQALAELV
jgi:hypothetical protein